MHSNILLNCFSVFGSSKACYTWILTLVRKQFAISRTPTIHIPNGRCRSRHLVFILPLTRTSVCCPAVNSAQSMCMFVESKHNCRVSSRVRSWRFVMVLSHRRCMLSFTLLVASSMLMLIAQPGRCALNTDKPEYR